MLVGIHKDPYGKYCDFLERYEEILSHNGIEYIRLEASQPDFWDRVSELDLFIFRWRQIDDHHQLAKTIIPIIEKEMGIRCFPDMATCWHYDDKIRQYFLLNQRGFPIIESWIFWDKKMALKWLEDADLPVVFKLKTGAASNNVVLVKNRASARKLIKRCFGRGIMSGRIPSSGDLRFKYFNPYKTIHRWGGNVLRILRDEDISFDWQKQKNYVLFQKFLPNNDYDTRVTVIGNRAYAFRRHIRENDFRASGSKNLDMDRSKIDLDFVKIGMEISEKLGFQSMAYDFIYGNGKPALIEISYTYPDEHAFSNGYWDSDFKWHEGRFWSQYFQLVDALGLPDLEQPKL